MNKLSSVRVLPRNPIAPGTGVLVVQGWTGGVENLEVAILENQQSHCLQLDGSWQSKECWFSCPFAVDADGNELRINVGNFLVNPLLLSGSSVVHLLKIREAGDSSSQAARVLQADRNLLPATAAGESENGSYVFQLPEAEKPAVEEPVSEPLPEPQPEPEPPVLVSPPPEPKLEPEDLGVDPPVVPPADQKHSGKKEGNGLKILFGVLAILVFLAVVAAAVWWFVLRAPSNSAEPEVEKEVPTQAAAPCSVEAMAESGEMAFVQACVAQSPSSDALLQTIQSAKQAGHCGIAQRLYANRAQAGDMTIALAYAKEYDPQFHQASDCFKAPEVDTAVYWWETILGFDANNEMAAQRLKDLKP
ncbi:MAG: hypothetical protein ACN6NT_06270 [Comamonas sp.]